MPALDGLPSPTDTMRQVGPPIGEERTHAMKHVMWLSAAVGLALWTTAGAAPRASEGALWDRFTGDWRVNAGAEKVVEKAVREATESMSVFTRNTARGRLLQRNAPPARIRMQRKEALFILEFAGSPVQSLPISGAPLQQGERTLRVQLDDGPQGALRHTGETPEGRRENVFRTGVSSEVMTMDVTVTSPRLSAPVRYVLEFTRVRESGTPSEQAQSH